MSKEIRWLHGESERWEEEGIISRDQGNQIRRLYPEPAAGLPWNTIIFSGLGAVIAGLGIILLIAYNWHALHKFAKLGIILGGIAALHASGLWLLLRTERWRQVGEAVCLMGSMLFGAGIWLLAQVYHIEEHYPNGFLIWGLGALALAWAMPSVAQGLLAVTVLCIWGSAEGWGFDQAMHGAPALVLAGTGLLAWRLRSRLLLFATLAAFLISLCANVSAVESALLLRVLVNCAVAFVAASVLVRRGSAFAESSGIWAAFGWFAFLVCLYLLTFAGITDDLLGWRSAEAVRSGAVPYFYEWGSLAGAVILWCVVGWRFLTSRRAGQPAEDCSFENWLLPMTAILCQALALARFTLDKWPLAGAFNLVFLALAGSWMAKGARQGQLGPMTLGSLLLTALVVARYFDLFDSLALRGVIFLGVGALFFAEGALFRRARQRARTPQASA